MIDFNQSTSTRSQCTREKFALTSRLLLLEEKGIYRVLISGFKGVLIARWVRDQCMLI